jgi:ABC-type lipoprotein export system ATPase subunit
MSLIKLDKVAKYYKSEETVSVGMKNISLEFDLGEFVAVTGESGSGKSTMLNVISGLDGYEDGELYLFGEETSHYTITDWEKYRGTYIGFVFQNYNIIDSYTVLQNVMLALEIQGYPVKERKTRALELIDKVGLTSHKNHKASKLSGGQKQRTVIARALAKDCPIIVADEPTGNLDSTSGAQVMKLLSDIAKDKLIIVVTHDYEQVAEYATRKIKMMDGEVVEDKKVKPVSPQFLTNVPKIKRMTFPTLLKFGLRNLLATPKKMIFMLLLQVIVMGVFTVIYTNQMQSVREADLGRSELFPSVPETRLLIEKRDGSSFTDQEVLNIGSMRYVRHVYKQADLLFNDVQINVRSTNMFEYANMYADGTDTAEILHANDVDGKIPVEKNEIVITTNNWSQFYIGQEVLVYVYDFGSGGELTIGTFVISGFDNLQRNTIYFSKAWIEQERTGGRVVISRYQRISSQISSNLSFSISGTEYYAGKSWQNNPQNITFYGDGATTVLTNQSVTFKSRYNMIEYTVVMTGVSISSTATNYGYAELSQSFYDSIIQAFMVNFESLYLEDNETVMLSVSVDGIFAGRQLIKNLDSETYKIYYPSNITDPMQAFTKFMRGILAFVSLTVIGLFLYTIVHAVTRNVMNSRKKDFAIYRSIGANQMLLARLVVLEQVMLSVVGFALTFGILTILRANVTIIRSSLIYMQFQDYFILVFAFMAFGAWLGLRFNKKVFKQSVIETLSASKGE